MGERQSARLLRDERDRLAKELRECRAQWRALKDAAYAPDHTTARDQVAAMLRVLNGNLERAAGDVSGWFDLIRHHDVSDVSGTGRVAEIAEFEDGTAVLRWLSGTPSTVVYESLDHVVRIHGHGGATELVPRVQPADQKGNMR